MAVYDLTIRGTLHLGEHLGIDREAALEWIPSDTLFSALVTTWVGQGVNLAERLAACQDPNAPGLQITSAFPRAGSVRFYPAPPRFPVHSGLLEAGSKAARKIRWISHEVLNTLRDGVQPATSPEYFIQGGSVWLSPSERNALAQLLEEDASGSLNLWKKQIVPHVTVDRGTQASNLFHSGRVIFQQDCGVWFAAHGNTEWVRPALLHLMDSGLGGMRSTGHGQFTFEENGVDLQPAHEGWGLLLSRYAPSSAEEVSQTLQSTQSAYRLATVGGWCSDDEGHAWRRRVIRMVEEGALLPTLARGYVPDVRPLKIEDWRGPQRPVYRMGLAYLIPAGKLVEAL